MMKGGYLFVLLALLISCDKINDKQFDQTPAGTYILNNGSYGGNNACIGVYDPVNKTYSADVFYSANQQKLGDVGQDIIACGEDLFVAVFGSKIIFVLDSDLKIKQRIVAEQNGITLSPKSFAEYDGKVYVTYYEGWVGEISKDYSLRLCKVGPNPEGIDIAGRHIYVANSGGTLGPDYDNSVSVVSIDDFTETSTITVNTNPCCIAASSDGAFVYVSSFGNYADIPVKLQVIDTETLVVNDLEYDSVSSIAKGPGDVLYILCGGYDEEWNPLPGVIYRHNMKQNAALGEFITDGTAIPDAYSISATADGLVYVGSSDYTSTGDFFVFTPDGRIHDKFDTQGINPQKACSPPSW